MYKQGMVNFWIKQKGKRMKRKNKERKKLSDLCIDGTKTITSKNLETK